MFFSNESRRRLVVLGDVMLDCYVEGNVGRISPEAPIPVLQIDQADVRLGGAAGVASFLRHLGAEVEIAGTVGDDRDANTLRSLLIDCSIELQSLIAEQDRPTTRKERFIGRAANRHPHQLLRVDCETCRPISPETERLIADGVKTSLVNAGGLLISDYGKGVCTLDLLREVIARANGLRVPVFVDPTRLDDYARYRGADAVTPNRTEAELVTRRKIGTPDDGLEAARTICAKFDVGAALVKLDRDGMALATAEGLCEIFPTRPREVYDVTGAGDMVLAVVALCRVSGMSWEETVKTANIAAGLEVERFGSTPITREELEQAILRERQGPYNKLLTLDTLAGLAESYRRQGRTLVFTNGCFDLLHVGHVTYLQEAAAMGDVLIVALNSDAGIRRLKGPGRPVIHERDRALARFRTMIDRVGRFAGGLIHSHLSEVGHGSVGEWEDGGMAGTAEAF